MPTVLRLLSLYNVLAALAVAAKFVFGVPQPSWDVMNWIMAAGIIVALAGSLYCKRQFDADGEAASDARRFLDVNVPFFAALGLFIAFGFMWSLELNDLSAAHGPASLWPYVNTAFVIISGMTGVRMWNAAGKMRE